MAYRLFLSPTLTPALIQIISIHFQRSDLNSKLRSRTDPGTSQSGKAVYLSITDGKCKRYVVEKNKYLE